MCQNALKHGRRSNGLVDPTYMSWQAMKARCKHKQHYADISVDSNWESFSNFLRDMGERPVNTTLDRINGTKGYYKDNCRWATKRQQRLNTSRTVIVKYKEQLYYLDELAPAMGLKTSTVKARLRRGWDLEKSLETPARRMHVQNKRRM